MCEKLVKVVIFTHRLEHYRLPIMELLANSVELTIVCSNASQFEGRSFNFRLVQVGIKRIGPFILFEKSVSKISSSFDIAIGHFNIRCLDLCLMSMNPFRRFGYISWGIGVTASYTKAFGQKGVSSIIRQFAGRFSDALVFYSDYPISIYKKIKNVDSLFVANNTISNDFYDSTQVENKDSILFIGSLYEGKGVSELIDSYCQAFKKSSGNFFSLNIIGDGEQRETLEAKVKDIGLSDYIRFYGAIYDQKLITYYHSRALASISPTQAGLSVLTSMSNAVPFITTQSAITGGEIFNINSGINGVILEDVSQLEDVLLEIDREPNKFIEMGNKARWHYENSRTPELMVAAFIDAIKYVSDSRR